MCEGGLGFVWLVSVEKGSLGVCIQCPHELYMGECGELGSEMREVIERQESG
jgi:hypothetical protein